jgi:hypothetical protein
MLQAFREEPALDVKCKDKFLILSAFVNEKTETMSLPDIVSKIFPRVFVGQEKKNLNALF